MRFADEQEQRGQVCEKITNDAADFWAGLSASWMPSWRARRL
jgi:hypothetical protein